MTTPTSPAFIYARTISSWTRATRSTIVAREDFGDWGN